MTVRVRALAVVVVLTALAVAAGLGTTYHGSSHAAAPSSPGTLPYPPVMNLLAQLFLVASVLVTIPIGRRSLRAAAWYWGLAGGASAGWFIVATLHLGDPRTDTIPYLVEAGVWLGPLVALNFRNPPRAPQGPRPAERYADKEDLRPHEIATWPAPALSLSAGTRWTHDRSGPHGTVYGVDANLEGRHTLLVVPTGLGKGLWTNTQLLTWGGSAVVNDLKADIYPQTAGWRSTLGPVYVLNVQAPVHRFDPTAWTDTEDDLRPLAHAVCTDPEDRDPYWAQYAARILLVLMLAAKRAGEPVFPFVARAVRSGAARALDAVAAVDRGLADRVRPHGESRGFTSAWETVVTRCESILSPSALATLSGSDFGAADLLQNRSTLYLQIPEARLDDLRPFLRLIWTSLVMQLITASDRLAQAHHPLLLLLDEAGRTPFAGLPDFLVTMRSRRISCAVLVQNLSQLRAAYDRETDVILGNSSVHVYSRTEDLWTAEYLSRRLGNAEEIVPTYSETRTPNTVFTDRVSRTYGQIRRFRPLATPQLIRAMQDHVVLTFLPACPPAAMARMDWRDHPSLIQRAQLPAPALIHREAAVPSPTPPPTGAYIEPD